MITGNKNLGETPLEFLNRLRIERPEIKDSVLSYAGRLDPMAEGEMLVLVDNENKERQKYLGLDKEYEATFLFGISTDTGDVLGLIKDEDEMAEISFQEISAITEIFLKIKSQKYPWFSSKTVFGIPLFEHFKKGNLDIERPTRSIEIKKLEVLEFNTISSKDLEKYIFDSVNKVNGDFRQSEILDSWRGFFQRKNPRQHQTLKIKLTVSSGTYIRALTELFPIPTTLLKLKRTKIHI